MKTKIVLALVLLLVLAFVRADETVPQTQTVLKSYFTTGAVPTETNYAELIDTMFYYVAAASSNATAAAASAASANSVLSNAVPTSANFHISGNSVTLLSAYNIANITATHGGSSPNYHYIVTCVFSNSFPTTNYFVYFPVPNDVTDVTRRSTNFVYESVGPDTVFNLGFIVK